MITGTFTTAVGNITTEIDDGGAQAYVDVSKLGNLKYEFDQTPDSVQIDRTIALYSYIQVVYNGLTDSSEDLYTRLIDATATSAIDCTLSIDNFGADTFEFSFELKQENIDYNEKTGEVSVRFTPKIDKEVTISNVMGGITNYNFEATNLDNNDLSGININCVPVEDYLSASMKSVFGNNYDAYIKLSKNITNTSVFRGYDSWASSNRGYVIVDPADLPLPFNNETTKDPKELSTTGVVVSNIEVIGPFTYTPDQDNFVQYTLVYNYYIQGTNLLSQFPVNSAVGWWSGEDVTPPLRVIRSLSTANNVVTAGVIDIEVRGIADPAPVGGSQQLFSNTRIYAYDSNLNQIANDSIKQLAGIEGSIYGTGFSKNFYVYRLSDNDANYVTLKYDNVSELKQKKLNKYLQEVVVRQIADYENEGILNFGQIPAIDLGGGVTQEFRMPNLKGAGSFVRGNESATKSLEINSAPVYPFLNKARKINTRFVSITDDDAFLERTLTSAGARSYAESLNQQDGGLKIEFTYLDALALKPYEVFQFDSTAPVKYRNKQYRITSISYDFVKNICKVVGYQISGLATPIVREPGPGTEVPRPEPPPTNTDISYFPGWNLISNPTTTNALGFSTVFGNDTIKGSAYIYNGKYEVVSNMQAPIYGNAYWVYFKDDVFNGNVKNYIYPGEIFDSNVTINVTEGWNMIPSLGVPTYPVSNTANIDSQTLYGFDGSYELVSVLRPGKGYWVYVDQDGDIKLNNQGTPIGVANLQEDFKRVDIATGLAAKSVYFDGTNTNTNVNVENLKFPPAVGQNFDVRINNSKLNTALRDLRAIESNTINIDVQQIDNATTLNIIPKIGVAASTYYQTTFLDGDKIITALNVSENVAVDVPITTSRIEVKPMSDNFKLPVRADDIANDEGQLVSNIIIEGISDTVSSRIQNLTGQGNLDIEDLISSTEPVFGDTGKGLGLFQKSGKQNVSVSADFSITPTHGRILVNSSTNGVEFQGIVYTAGGGERITVVFENAGTNNIIVKHDSTNVLDGYRLYLPGGEDIKVVSNYASMTFEFTNYSSADEWQLVSFTQYGGDIVTLGKTINPIVELPLFATERNNYAIGSGTVFSVERTVFHTSNDITGFAGGTDGREIEILNRASTNVEIIHQSSNSTDINRVINPSGSNIELTQYDSVRLRYYEGSINRWIVVGGKH